MSRQERKEEPLDSMARQMMAFHRLREKWGRDRIKRAGTAKARIRREKGRVPERFLLRSRAWEHASVVRLTGTPAATVG